MSTTQSRYPRHWMPENASTGRYVRLDGWVLDVGVRPGGTHMGQGVVDADVDAPVGWVFRPLPALAPMMQQAGVRVPAPAAAAAPSTALEVRPAGALEAHRRVNDAGDLDEPSTPMRGSLIYARPDPLAEAPWLFLAGPSAIAAMREADRRMPPPAWWDVPASWLEVPEIARQPVTELDLTVLRESQVSDQLRSLQLAFPSGAVDRARCTGVGVRQMGGDVIDVLLIVAPRMGKTSRTSAPELGIQHRTQDLGFPFVVRINTLVHVLTSAPKAAKIRFVAELELV